MSRFHTLLAAVGLAVMAPLAPASAAKPPVHTGVFGNVALGGHDPVAYFREGRPVKGARAFTARHKGAEYRFASAANRDAFVADPDRYAPQYGGYCAWAVSQGYTASGDPNVWKIVNGRLYLNYNAEVGRRWEQDIPGHIRKADSNWPKVLG
jgi:YHS domain-containing protein